MSVQLNPMTLIDCYKFDHRRQYPPNTTRVYSNWTPRGSKYANGMDEVVVFGIQAMIRDLKDRFDVFFNTPEDQVRLTYQRRLDGMLGPNAIGVEHILELHRLGYLPLEFRAIQEGRTVPFRIPVLTVENTHNDFFWLVNYIETYLSAQLWQPMTSASIALHMRKMLDRWAAQTSDSPEFVDFQGHDFSFRGMTSVESAAASGAGHLLSFAGTDTVPALDWLEYFYQASGPIGLSVAATEHSVMSAGGDLGEAETFARLLELYPSGIVSVVSDTWDLWNVLTNIVPGLKAEVLARDGKLVIRPDSGDPVDILCGTVEPDDPYYPQPLEPVHKGVIELLWDAFGGTINSKGYKELDPHVGAIYGDSITYDRANQICARLEAKGFASTNVVLGVGSFTYQYNTRDTLGFAMKATWAEVDGEGRNLFKDPVTDDGLKRSATGRLAVFEDQTRGGVYLLEDASDFAEESPHNLLQPVFRNGKFLRTERWSDVVSRVGVRYLK